VYLTSISSLKLFAVVRAYAVNIKPRAGSWYSGMNDPSEIDIAQKAVLNFHPEIVKAISRVVMTKR
jgi:hypothetical protein